MIVLLDACVLIPMPLADTLLRLAADSSLYQPKWSERIMTEVSRNLEQNFGLSRQKAMHRETEIRRHFPEAWVEGYDDLIPKMTNHPKDRHVLAAAVHAHAQVIVTYNRKDFPDVSLASHSIQVQAPSAFLNRLYDTAPFNVIETLDAQARAIGQTRQYLLSRLRINAPVFVSRIEAETSPLGGS
jgi:predicted nucleic acid-binding protein